MPKVWIYILGASSKPDAISCQVPWQVDNEQIFFGPCKKSIRKKLRDTYLAEHVDHREVHDAVYMVGMNATNTERVRKVVWWGRVSEVMTFSRAYCLLKGPRYHGMRTHRRSPLHVEPIIASQRLVGYRRRSLQHAEEDKWIDDLVSPRRRPMIQQAPDQITVRQRTAWQTFDRDCCMLLENRFFAENGGIKIDADAVEILQGHPRNLKRQIDDYAIFGTTTRRFRKDGSERLVEQVDGLRGTFLELDGILAQRFVAWLEGKGGTQGGTLPYGSGGGGHGPAKTRCS